MELKELITGAQEAMDQGDYRLAIAASEHALVGYDACLAAHRMLGEAYLERGDQQAAITHFERTLAIDPLNVVAELGLGVASEETRRYEAAYTHYLSAWENNPALDQVRDELVRLRGVLEVDERLHPTRAGLAGIHTRTGQFARAAAEWRAILAVEPNSARARTALAELLWRQGDDAGAAAAAREAMRGSPENARALAILADIEKRRGGGNANDLAQRYCGVDPTGEVLAILRGWRSDAELGSLLPGSILIDEFDFERNRTRQTSGLSRKSLTGSLATSQMAAPDLWDTLVHDLNTGVPSKPAPTLATGVEPFNWTEGQPIDRAPEMTPTPMPKALPDDSDIFPELALLGGDVAPFDPGDPEPAPAFDVEAAQVPSPVDAVPEWIATAQSDFADASAHAAIDADLDLDLVPFSLDEITGVVAPAHELDESVLAASFGTLPEPEPVMPPQPAASVAPELPADPDVSVDPVLPAYNDPFVTADGRIDLTAGWDTLDRELEAATPSANGGGFDALLAELGVDGVVPFDATIESADEDAWSPFADGDFDAPVAELPHAADSDIPSVDLLLPDASGETLDMADVEALDVNAFLDPVAEPAPASEPAPALGNDILAGIPLPEPSGYTQLLRNIDEESLPDHDEQDDELDPFANPDASGAPLAFDELIEVTSSDGTGPLTARPEEMPAEMDLATALDFSRTDLSAAMPAAPSEPLDFAIDGLEPFDSSGFDVLADDSAQDRALEAEPLVAEAPAPAVFPPEEPIVADLGDVAPFAFDDGAGTQADGAPMDFSELDVAPEPMIFSPAAAQTAETFVFDEPEAEPFEFEPAAAAVAEADESGDWSSGESDEAPFEFAAEHIAVVDEPIAAGIQVADVREPEFVGSASGGIGVRSVPWPQFMGQTSELIDRPMESGSLFARIAAQKEALVEMGVVATGKRLSPVIAVPEPRIAAVAPPPVVDAPAVVEAEPTFGPGDQPSLDLMAMRVRLIEDESAAREIADTLEAAIADGLQTPLALRVLGEAYLKLGMVERAAAQFRQAMLTRRRGA